mmetsp:Transcript_11060/g.45120  ORF Transcript_11060/g.45120 Transcript_11060/m.45120 type:complete len:332 (-) Transcript_11060:93-1088(-)
MGAKGKKKSSSSKSNLDDVETVKDDIGLEMEVLVEDMLMEEPDPTTSSKSTSTTSSPRTKRKKSKSSSSKSVLSDKEVIVSESMALEMEQIETIVDDMLEEELSPPSSSRKGKSHSKKKEKDSPRSARGKESSKDSKTKREKSTLSVSSSKPRKSPRSPRGHTSDKDKEKDREKERENGKSSDSKRDGGHRESSSSSSKKREERKKEADKKDDKTKLKSKAKDSKDPKRSPKPRREERGVVSAPVIVDRMAAEPLSVQESMQHMQHIKNKVGETRAQLQTERERTLEIYGDYKDLSWKELVAMHIRLRIKIQRLDTELKDLRLSKTSKTHG